jgi:hypothetical protein
VRNPFAHGTVHEAGEDLQAAVRSNPEVLTLWKNLTPLGRNEFILLSSRPVRQAGIDRAPQTSAALPSCDQGNG